MRLTTRLTALVTTPALALAGLVALSVSTAAPAGAAATAFSIPTPAAGLGRITTAPNGDMWFVEEDAQKIGRITPSGQVEEIDLSVDSDYARVTDLDVAPDGTLWVLVDSGAYAVHLRPDPGLTFAQRLISIQQIGAGPCVYDTCPYGEQVRVAPNGVGWASMSYDRQFATTFTDAGYREVPASPPCDGPLGEAGDGSMWCSNGGTMFHLPGNGGIPVGDGASNPRAIAAGPVGDIWFASSTSDGPLTSPGYGNVGYLSGATPVRFGVGSKVGPNDLVRGPDGNMWFTSTGFAKGIGHVSPAGRGALTQVGGYAPESLTFGADGAVWFTDATNNVIVRVPTSDLQVTNVDPGAGSVFTPGQGATPKPPVKVSGKKTVRVTGGRVPLTLSCPKGTKGGCRGKVVLRTAKAVTKPGAGKKAAAKVLTVSSKATFRLKAGKKTTVRPRLTGLGAKVVKRGKATKVAVTVDGARIGTLEVRR